MKKLLGISLVAVLAVSPLMANADPVGTGTGNAYTPAAYVATGEEDTGASVTATTTPKFGLREANNATDGNAASAGYVKGAYNAAIKAVNAVHDEAVAAQAAADAAAAAAIYTGGDGINIDNNNEVTLDYATTGGLTIDNGKAAVNVDGTTITKDSTTGALEVGSIASSNISDKVVSDGANAAHTSVATQGYVEDAVATAVNGAASETGVVNTIKNVNLTNGTMTGALATGTVATIMTNWGDDTSSTNVTAVTGLGTLGTNVSIDDSSVSYTTTAPQS